jgi:hypothetical protein
MFSIGLVRWLLIERQLDAQPRYPPFSKDSAPEGLGWRDQVPPILWVNGRSFCPIDDIESWLNLELLVPKVLSIYNSLWLAGLPRPARPLHRQVLMGRQLLITEDPNQHLVWYEHTFFLKPLPAYLLSYSAWNDYLCPHKSEDIYGSACGLLLSYTWLIQYPSDFFIAKQENLVPSQLTWDQWRRLITSFQQQIEASTWKINARYQYGELRLTRLNSIYRFLPPVFTVNNFSRGFMAVPTWYKAFFLHNFQWLLAVFAYVTVMLSAMQVGLSTPQLQGSVEFTNASYGFAVAAMVATAAAAVLIAMVWTILFWYHLLSTMRYVRKIQTERERRNVASSRP